MRPVLLEFAGFGSFREPALVDFADADYFAIVGPTGAGKSTVVDALTFALYGTVARWDDRRTVALALPPAGARATVRLVFDLRGERYLVARELRRSPGGAVGVRGARLERLADPAAPADDDAPATLLAADSGVTPAVERLLGLPFEHFRACVVLPQGQFAQFLHARPGDRQRILVKLLGLEVYEAIGRAAAAEASAAGQRADLLGEHLAGLADATEEAARQAERQLRDVAAVATAVRAALPRLRALEQAGAQARDAAARLIAERDALGRLTVPEGAAALGAEASRVAARSVAAEAALAAAEQADSAAREALAASGDRTPLEAARAGYAELTRLEGPPEAVIMVFSRRRRPGFPGHWQARCPRRVGATGSRPRNWQRLGVRRPARRAPPGSPGAVGRRLCATSSSRDCGRTSRWVSRAPSASTRSGTFHPRPTPPTSPPRKPRWRVPTRLPRTPGRPGTRPRGRGGRPPGRWRR
jgi:exonuclease SbcC